ncbi:MAG: hypothetical protein ISS88_01225 [Candidatus Portnoybacteria bacterium]|nr:hypothetical protein [Candidatus Portnoybacteria bacterium]
MKKKRLLKSVKREIDKEYEARKKKINCSESKRVEFGDSGCYCSDHHEHGAFAPIEENF